MGGVKTTNISSSEKSLKGPYLGTESNYQAVGIVVEKDHLYESQVLLKQDGLDKRIHVNISQEFSELFQLAMPISLAFLLEYIPTVSMMILAGHLPFEDTKTFVDAIVISNMFLNVTALSAGIGLCTAMDTLCSQAVGAEKPKKMSVFYQSGMIILGLSLIPITIVSLFSEQLLIAVGQDPEVSRLAAQFTIITLPSLPFFYIYELNKKVLQAQGIVTPMVIFSIIGNLVTIGLGYLVAYHTSLGVYGPAIGHAAGFCIMTMCLVPYYWISGNRNVWWDGWDLKEAWAHVGVFLSLGVPGFLMVAMEWWAYEAMALMAGLLPNPVLSLAVHSVIVSVCSFVFVIYMGISIAGNIRVGTALGANEPQKARIIAKLSIGLAVVVSSIAGVVIYFARHEMPKIFISDHQANSRAEEVLILLAIYTVVDGTNATVQGIYRGCGRQDAAAILNGVAFYGVGLPLGAILAFKFKMDVEGLWYGFGTGVLVCMIVCMTFILRSSWKQLALEAQERTE